MSALKYTPDLDLKVHEEGAIRLICSAFQSHENGLPEWIKNSSDAYCREDAKESKRAIVIIFEHLKKNKHSSISCLDFSGMTSEMIQNNFRVWADPNAASQGKKTTEVQGGHGNGGKCYMTQMFNEYSMVQTVKNGKGCNYGVVGGSLKFGYIPDQVNGKDFDVDNQNEKLNEILKSIGCSIEILPDVVKEAMKVADGFTLITGVGPKNYKEKIPINTLISNLQEHQQMIRTLELCDVYVVVNGHLYNNGKQLALPEIEPIEGAEEPRIIQIPESLLDPLSEDIISTTDELKLTSGRLILKTSKVLMRRSKALRHTIGYITKIGYIGYVPVSELDIQSPYRERIYGECYLEALEAFKQNDRSRLAKSPLTRAVEKFIADQIQKYAKEFEARDRRMYDQEERNAISKINEALDRWKNRFISELLHGLWGQGELGKPQPPASLPTGKPSRIEVFLSHNMSGIGVVFRPNIKFFDNEGKRVRPIPFKWVSEDNNIAMVDEDLMLINTFSYGNTYIFAETLDGKLKSNRQYLEVVCIHEIKIVPTQIEISVGSRQKLDAVCKLEDNTITSEIYLEWVANNPNIANVSSSGLVFGFEIGETEVIAGDDHLLAKESAHVKVIPGHGKSPGEKHGRGYPRVFISGEIDRDPDTNEYKILTREYPPVWQDPFDVERNIWWINSSSPLAKLYLDKSKNYGYQSREWRMYHLERYIDIIVQITLKYGPLEIESLSIDDWILESGRIESEIQSAVINELNEFIASGELPES